MKKYLVVIVLFIFSGCFYNLNDLGYIDNCKYGTQDSAIDLLYKETYIEVRFPEKYRKFDRVLIARMDNSGDICTFDKYVKYEQQWVCPKIEIKDVYGKYGFDYCRWRIK